MKKAKAEAEDAKVGLRGARKEAIDEIKKLQKSGLPEDEAKGAEANVQKLTDSYTEKIEKHLEFKEKEILTV